MKLIEKLERDLLAMGAELEVDPILDSHAARFRIFAPKWKEWASSGTNCLTFSYGNHGLMWMRGAINEARQEIAHGFNDASQGTIDAMGWEEKTNE